MYPLKITMHIKNNVKYSRLLNFNDGDLIKLSQFMSSGSGGTVTTRSSTESLKNLYAFLGQKTRWNQIRDELVRLWK